MRGLAHLPPPATLAFLPRRRRALHAPPFPCAGPLARFIDVDQEVAAQLFPGVRLLSLRSYYDSLLPKGNVSLQGLLVSGLDRFGWRVALPLALFVPPSWCKDGEAGSLLARVSAAIGGLLSSTLTTLDLLALSSTAQRAHGFGSVASATLVSASKHCRPQLLLLPPPLLLLLPGAAKTRPSSPPHADR